MIVVHIDSDATRNRLEEIGGLVQRARPMLMSSAARSMPPCRNGSAGELQGNCRRGARALPGLIHTPCSAA